MTIPFCDLARLYNEQKSDIQGAVAETLGSGQYILGPQGKKFEDKLSARLGGSQVVGCNSGTGALVLSLLASGVPEGSEVIVPSFTAVPTVAAVRQAGDRPIFVDIDPKTWTVNPGQVCSLVNPNTRAIIVVHIYGNVAPVDELMKQLRVMGRTDIMVIEDVAQAFGSRLGAKEVGTFGHMGTYSFYPTKNLGALGDAGAICTSNETLAATLRKLRFYGFKDRNFAELEDGINSRLDEIQATILNLRLEKLSEWEKRKFSQCERYRTELKPLPIQFQAIHPKAEPAMHLFVIALESGAVRDKLKSHLDSRGIQTLIHYPTPVHRQPAFFRFAKKTDLPVTEDLCSRILSLPMNPGLTASEQEAVVGAIKAFF